MFGVVEASRADENHPGSGLHYTLDVTDVVRELESAGSWDPDNFRVAFIPKRRRGTAALALRPNDHEIHVGRVSLYYA